MLESESHVDQTFEYTGKKSENEIKNLILIGEFFFP